MTAELEAMQEYWLLSGFLHVSDTYTLPAVWGTDSKTGMEDGCKRSLMCDSSRQL